MPVLSPAAERSLTDWCDREKFTFDEAIRLKEWIERQPQGKSTLDGALSVWNWRLVWVLSRRR